MLNIITKTKTTDDLQADLKRLLNPLGGLQNFIKPGEKVLLKPNFNTADSYPGCSAYDFLKTVIQLVRAESPSRIILGDSSTLLASTKKVMEDLAIFEMGEKLGVEIVNFEKSKFVKKKLKGKFMKSVSVPAILDEVDKLILLPCLKTHRYARFTMSLKIGVGLMRKRERILLHLGNLESKIAELNLAYQPDLIILDGRKAFVSGGPDVGELVEPNILMAGVDRLALDAEALKVLKSYPAKNKLNLGIWRFPTIKRAVEIGLGASSENDYQIIEV